MTDAQSHAGEQQPRWSTIGLLLVLAIVLIGFGNADRLFWRLNSQGAELPGIVVSKRSYRAPDATEFIYMPTVAFRDPDGVVRVIEVERGSVHYDLAVDQPVRVLWAKDRHGIAIDVPLRRSWGTSMVMWLVTGLGSVCWLWAIWLMMRRVRLAPKGLS